MTWDLDWISNVGKNPGSLVKLASHAHPGYLFSNHVLRANISINIGYMHSREIIGRPTLLYPRSSRR